VIQFARLFAAIDQTNSTTAKVDAMAAYFTSAPPADAAWAVFFLTGRRLKRLVPGASIHAWTLAATGLDAWLLDECYAVVGDGAETAALLLDQLPALSDARRSGVEGPATDISLAEWIEDRILPLRIADPEDQESYVIAWVREMDRWQRLILFKLLTGELRLGVSQTLVVRALAQATGLPGTTMAARLMGEWTPTAQWFSALGMPAVTDDDLSRPYPFYLAAPIETAGRDRVASSDAQISGVEGAGITKLLGDLQSWLIEWKWDGIRAQLVKRAGRIHLWSRGEELITERFPEVIDAAAALPDGTVLDGEILAFRGDRPLPFSALQQRIGRQTQIARKARDVPVVFMTYDILEHEGIDIRAESLAVRRQTLEEVVAASYRTPLDSANSSVAQSTPAGRPSRRAGAAPLLPFEDGDVDESIAGRESAAAASVDPPPATLRLSPLVDVGSWADLARLRDDSRAYGVEGLMLKRRDSPYGVGRKRGDWWKWKIDPFTIDAVLIYAQPGSGKRASLLTDYTFGLWDNGELVPVAKAYSGLTNEEIAEMDRWIRRHTITRFGPVRHVEPIHVFELGFEAIAKSSRHRSGVAVRFPRMLRWRKDKPASEADTLETLRAMIQ
jgi:DNA ligase-1